MDNGGCPPKSARSAKHTSPTKNNIVFGKSEECRKHKSCEIIINEQFEIKIFIDDQKNLRQIAGLKIYVIALVWTFTTVILPLYNSNQNLNVDVLLTSIQRFIFIIILMLPFEIRDLNFDSLKLATIPQKIGVKNTKIIGVFLLMIFFLLEYFKDEVSNNSIMTTLVITFFTLLSVVFSSKKQSKYYSAFWVESLPVLWLIVLLILR